MSKFQRLTRRSTWVLGAAYRMTSDALTSSYDHFLCDSFRLVSGGAVIVKVSTVSFDAPQSLWAISRSVELGTVAGIVGIQR